MNGRLHIPVILFVAVFVCGVSFGQDARQNETSKRPACRSEDALTIIEQQIDATKTFDDDGRRVAVLIRAAEILWAYKEETTRKAYADAFALAKRHFKEKGDRPDQEGKLSIGKPDLRYTVISSIARHDAKWAKK